MRVAIVTHKITPGDGQGRVNYEIARAGLEHGHQMVLIASEIAPDLEAHPSTEWVHIPVSRWPTELLRNQVFAWRSFRWLRNNRSRLDVVHVNGSITWAPSDINASHFLHSAWLRSPLHIAKLRRDLYGTYQWLYTALNARWERRTYGRQAKVVVAVSEETRNDLVKIGVPGERVRVITNGADLQEFSPGPADRRELGLPDRVPLAIFVGDIRTSRKNLDTVLNALVRVPELHLAVVGSTKGSPYLRLAEQLGLTPRVHFLGHRRDVNQLMRAADMFVFPSRFEEFPLVILEAMASGLPVVSATTAGADDLVSPECGVVVEDPNDTNALAAALERLVQSPDERKRMGHACRLAVEPHTFRRMSDQYLQLYEEVANRKVYS